MGPSADFQEFASSLNSPALRAIAEHWHQARGGRLMPDWGSLSTSELSPHFQLLWGFHYDARTGDFTGRLAGKNVKEWLGANFWGASLRDIHSAKAFADAQLFLTKVIKSPAAGRCAGILFNIDDLSVTGERIALPLAADGISADGILGASAYECPVRPGNVELIHENMEWFAI